MYKLQFQMNGKNSYSWCDNRNNYKKNRIITKKIATKYKKLTKTELFLLNNNRLGKKGEQ